MKKDKLQDQFIVDHHIITHMKGIIPMDMCSSKIDSYFFDINLSSNDHHDMSVKTEIYLYL